MEVRFLKRWTRLQFINYSQHHNQLLNTLPPKWQQINADITFAHKWSLFSNCSKLLASYLHLIVPYGAAAILLEPGVVTPLSTAAAHMVPHLEGEKEWARAETETCSNAPLSPLFLTSPVLKADCRRGCYCRHSAALFHQVSRKDSSWK